MEDLYGKDVEDLVLRSYSLMYCVTLAKLFNYWHINVCWPNSHDSCAEKTRQPMWKYSLYKSDIQMLFSLIS